MTVHKDIDGNEIAVGDKIVFADWDGDLHRGTVVKIQGDNYQSLKKIYTHDLRGTGRYVWGRACLVIGR